MHKEFLWEDLLEHTILRPRRSVENNTKMNLRETDCEEWRWVELAQDHVQQWSLVLVLNLWILLPVLVV